MTTVTVNADDLTATRVVAGVLQGFDYDVPDDADAMEDARAILATLSERGFRLVTASGGAITTSNMVPGVFCRECGSQQIGHTLGPCADCGESLDGEAQPASRAEGLFHRRCWNSRGGPA